LNNLSIKSCKNAGFAGCGKPCKKVLYREFFKEKKQNSIKSLQSVMNIGTVTARRLYAIGITSPSMLKRQSPEKVYQKLKEKEGGALDICVLYQIRGAIRNSPWWLCKDSKR